MESEEFKTRFMTNNMKDTIGERVSNLSLNSSVSSSSQHYFGKKKKSQKNKWKSPNAKSQTHKKQMVEHLPTAHFSTHSPRRLFLVK